MATLYAKKSETDYELYTSPTCEGAPLVCVPLHPPLGPSIHLRYFRDEPPSLPDYVRYDVVVVEPNNA